MGKPVDEDGYSDHFPIGLQVTEADWSQTVAAASKDCPRTHAAPGPETSLASPVRDHP